MDIFELTPEAKLKNVKEYGLTYYDQAKWSGKHNQIDMAVFSVTTSTQIPDVNPETGEETGKKTGEVGVNFAVRNKSKDIYSIDDSITLITSNGSRVSMPVYWTNSDPAVKDDYPDKTIQPDSTLRLDLAYQLSPKLVKDIEWIKLGFNLWNDSKDQLVKEIVTDKIMLGEPTVLKEK